MSTRLLAAAARLPLLWATCYTAGLPQPLRASRRAEIASDTHEHVADPLLGGWRLALDIIQSTLKGASDDLRWRAGHISPTGELVQSLIAAAPLAALSGYTVFHITGNGLVAVATATAATCVTVLALTLVSHSEGSTVLNSTHAGEPEGRASDRLTVVSAILYPLLVLAAMLTIPMASGDPSGDEVDIARRAAESPSRWATGYAIYALGAMAGVVAVLGIGTRIRLAGAGRLGIIAPALFAVGSMGVIAAGHGVVGIGLAMAVDSGASGEDYLNADVWPALLALGGAILCGLGSWALAAGVWRSGLVSGWGRNICVAALLIHGLMIGLGAGHGVNAVLLLNPISGIVAMALILRGAYLSLPAPSATVRPNQVAGAS